MHSPHALYPEAPALPRCRDGKAEYATFRNTASFVGALDVEVPPPLPSPYTAPHRTVLPAVPPHHRAPL